MNLQTLIEQASQPRMVRNVEGKEVQSYLSSAEWLSPVGRITCFVDHSHGNAKGRGKHVHCRFDLNGKRIKREDLVKLLA